MSTQIVAFKLGEEEYGINIASVESIIKMQAITVVPQAPKFVIGVTNLRGNIVPVIDLKTRLDLEATETTQDSRIVVALLRDAKIGMVVDSVSQVIDVEESQIEPKPQMATSIDSSFISGVAKIDDELVILLDLEEVLTNTKDRL